MSITAVVYISDLMQVPWGLCMCYTITTAARAFSYSGERTRREHNQALSIFLSLALPIFHSFAHSLSSLSVSLYLYPTRHLNSI